MDGTIYVDLDGTLAQYEKWESPEIIGEPIPAMMDRVKRWIMDGRRVKIFTARFVEHHGHVREWLFRHGIGGIEVTNVKGIDGLEFWDDRAVSVEKNTGRVLTLGEHSNHAEPTDAQVEALARALCESNLDEWRHRSTEHIRQARAAYAHMAAEGGTQEKTGDPIDPANYLNIYERDVLLQIRALHSEGGSSVPLDRKVEFNAENDALTLKGQMENARMELEAAKEKLQADRERVFECYDQARNALNNEPIVDGTWIGQLKKVIAERDTLRDQEIALRRDLEELKGSTDEKTGDPFRRDFPVQTSKTQELATLLMRAYVGTAKNTDPWQESAKAAREWFNNQAHPSPDTLFTIMYPDVTNQQAQRANKTPAWKNAVDVAGFLTEYYRIDN